MFVEKTVAEIEALSTEDQVKYFNALKEHKEAELEKKLEDMKEDTSKALKEEIKTLKSELNEANLSQLKVLQEAMEKQGLAIADLMNKGGGGNEPLTLAKQLEDKKEEIKGLFEGTKKTVTIKTITTRASVADNEEAYTLPDIGQLPTAKRNAYEVFPKIRISDRNDNGVIRYYDWDLATTVRAAEMRAEGVAFPESTAKWQGYTLDIKKVGDTIPYTKEMEEDSQMFAAELGMFLETNVKIKENDQIVNGDGTGNNLTGLFASVPAYTPVASGITDASIYDLVVKLRETIEAPYSGKYTVDVGFMNLSDINKYKLKKDANNNYIIPPFYDASGNRIDGVTIIEDNAVTANTMVVGDRKYGRVYEKTGYELTKGLVGDQFIEDEETLKARKRLAFLIREVDKTGFLKVTSISAALTTLAS